METAAAAAAAGGGDGWLYSIAKAALSANAYWTLSPEGVLGPTSVNLTKPLALPVATSQVGARSYSTLVDSYVGFVNRGFAHRDIV